MSDTGKDILNEAGSADLPELHDESIMFDNWAHSSAMLIPFTDWKFWHMNEFLYFHHRSGALIQFPAAEFSSGKVVFEKDRLHGNSINIGELSVNVPDQIVMFMMGKQFAEELLKALSNLKKHGSNYPV